MFDLSKVKPVESKGNAANIAGQGTIRDVLRSHGAKNYTNWRNTTSSVGRKAMYFRSGDGITQFMVLTGERHNVQEGEKPDLDTPVIQNAVTGAYFTAPGSRIEENIFSE